MPYIENIKVGSGEAWPVRDKEGRELIANIWSTIYPIGSIYMSVNSANPSVLFGGTWERIQDTFLLAAGETYGAGATGGEAEHTLTVDEMPSHSHTAIEVAYGYSDWTGSVQDSTLKHKLDDSHNTWNVTNASWIGRDTFETGGNQPHNNMPPYLAVYMWKRTA